MNELFCSIEVFVCQLYPQHGLKCTITSKLQTCNMACDDDEPGWVGGLVGWWVVGLLGWWVGGLVGWWVGGLVGWWVGGLVGELCVRACVRAGVRA